MEQSLVAVTYVWCFGHVITSRGKLGEIVTPVSALFKDGF